MKEIISEYEASLSFIDYNVEKFKSQLTESELESINIYRNLVNEILDNLTRLNVPS